MKHGLVRNESFRGAQLMEPPSRILMKKIGLPMHETYRFVGYKTSILRHLIDCGDEVVNGSSDDGFSIQVHVGDVAKTATELITGQIQSAAFGGAGEASTAISAIGTALDGVSVLGMIDDMLPESERPPLTRPGRVAVKKDHIMNGKLIVDITMHQGLKAGWADTGKQQITLKDVAYIVHDY
jgi:hypothetical protein